MIRLIILGITLLGVVGCTSTTPSIHEIALETTSGSGEPFLFTTSTGQVLLSYIEPLDASTHALRFRIWNPSSHTWSEAKTIASGKNWFVNWADFPSLIQTSSGRLVAHWLVRSGDSPYAYNIQISYSDDQGDSWSPPRVLHDDQAPAEHGFVSLLPTSPYQVLAVWLDGRKFARGREEMTLRTRYLLDDGSLSPETVLDTLTCDCCQTAAAWLGDQAIVFYRDRTPEEIRDIYQIRQTSEGWSTPQPVQKDNWHIPGCPVNGPATSSTDKHLWLAWFTGAQQKPRVFVRRYTSEGLPMLTLRIDAGAPLGRVDIVALPDGSALASWLEALPESTEQARWLIRRITAEGTLHPPIELMQLSASRRSGFPKIAQSGDQLILAWTAVDPTQNTQIKTAYISLEDL